MTEPLCSIVVPSFQQGRWIESTLRSLLQQRDPALEIIVVDGGSTDGTREILEKFRPQLAACVIEPDDGQAHALQKGFALAKGEYLGWLNSDDMHLPWTLRAMREAFAADASLELLHGDRMIVDGDGCVTGYRCLPCHSSYLLNRWPWTHQETCFWRRGLWERAGGIDRDLRFAMDYDLFVRLFRAGQCRHLRMLLGVFRWHDASKSFSQQRTTGATEIAAVRARYQCGPTMLERPIGTAFSIAVRACSRLHGWRTHRSDRPTRLGFNADSLWHDCGNVPTA